ncbi:MAG: sigma-54-dependent Fis family transcriptional regulator [Gemmatimonadetes bacterium]|nr:sigma-54-dependent Fis family transcriptional regulator [Gemmatimonadota bacterium]
MSGTVLVSTHRLPVAGTLRKAFQRRGYQVDLASDPSQLDAAGERVLLVLTGEGASGEVSRWMEMAWRGMGIPVFAIFSGPDAVEKGRRAGAEESFGDDPDPEEVVLLGLRAIQRRSLQTITGIVGESDSIREVLERVVQIAPADSTVLITGESGTGKELVARGIHALSSRRHRSFLAVNVAAISNSLLESELFGHEKGAFTGAIDSRRGFFELAHKGTLFLDEIGEMPLSTQTKLLRVLEQQEFLRVGGERPIRVDVRIIAATNQSLRDMVAIGRFRRDLYYRVNILGIELPPLRHRREDIPRLVAHFVRELGKRTDRPFPGISDEGMELLVLYDWPGNVRELRNLVESMVVLAHGKEIGPQDLPPEIRSPGDALRLLPATMPRPAGRSRDGEMGDHLPREMDPLRPEIELLFRTMVELKVDVVHLRRDFELYRERVGSERIGSRVDRRAEEPLVLLPEVVGEGGGIEVGTWVREGDGELGRRGPTVLPIQSGSSLGTGPDLPAEEQGVVFRPGMTMDTLEEEAIRAVLRKMGGNRRRAAESLGIGERTLYRKIKKYGIEE